ncbi:MAG: arylsulfatase [Pseudomonadales bacterium]|nr:arylsulfatase [Pseudomonadales bacterium]
MNILLIVADDLGYTDLGAFGGEIPTPHLDSLAHNGIRLSNFHTGASCAPTRSMLLSGTDNHLAGMGSQIPLTTPNQVNQPGYQDRLSTSVKSIAKSLHENGYRTYMTGKWHLGSEAAYLPNARGFDRSYALLNGGGGHFDDSPLLPLSKKADWRQDDQPIELPGDFNSSVTLTDKLMHFIESDQDQTTPFFAYLAYTAPHWPLQAPDDLIKKYQDKYAMGYDKLRESRMTGALREGVVPTGTTSVKHTPGLKPWHTLSADKQAGYIARMGIYAAMIDLLDQNVGRLLDFLEQRGELENTIIFFMSDNGAEGHAVEEQPQLQKWLAANFDNSFANLGRVKSYVTVGEGWARATAAPFRLTKGRISEGGIRAPAFVKFPRSRNKHMVDNSYMTVMDLAPTFMEIAGAPIPDQYWGQSLLPRLQGSALPVHDDSETISFESFGRRAVQKGDWKLLLMEPPFGKGQWELFNLKSDLGEQQDLALQYPEIVSELSDAWELYAKKVGVILPEHPIRY